MCDLLAKKHQKILDIKKSCIYHGTRIYVCYHRITEAH